MKILLIPVILILLSCEQPTIPVVQESIATPEITEEEIIMERTIIMNPIPAALGYLFKNGLLRGITSETNRTDFTGIKPSGQVENSTAFTVSLNDFFTKDGKKYFSFTDRYNDENQELVETELFFEQDGQAVTEIQSLPDKPAEPKMLIGEKGPFSFTTYKWEGVDYNKLAFTESGAIISTAKGFDSAVLTDKGILFSQPETLSRISGLWYMGNEQNGGPTRIGDYQIIY